jgi:dolichyl-diphosphooligosaccharide--protein glycosyltransferase/undecaprenyl-diphosphooligosaccharide--protein glycosyltransferase
MNILKTKNITLSSYILLLLTFMMFAMMSIDGYKRFIIVIMMFVILKLKKKLLFKYLYYLFGLSLVLFMVTGGFDPIWEKLKGYLSKDAISISKDMLSLHFFKVAQTIREAGQIPFETFANRISGHTITFILSIIGYIWLCFKHRSLLLGLPMVGLGFLALSGGLRFTIYAVPILALGIAFLIYQISRFLSNLFINDKVAMIMKYIFMVILTIAILFPNILHIIQYKAQTVFTKDEVLVLDKLKKIASREDYVVSWWDYGFPIRYYANVKTLSDGGKHRGEVNFPISFILTHSQLLASKMLRLDVEYTENKFQIDESNKKLDKNNTKYIKLHSSNIGQMTLDYGYLDTNDFLYSLQTDIKLPSKTRDIYIYLPNRMMNIYPTVNLFSNLDLMTGIRNEQPFFFITRYFREIKDIIDLGRGVKLDRKIGKLTMGNRQITLKRIVKTVYKKGKLQKQIQKIDSSSNINLIYMSDYNQFIIVDDDTYNSLYFQLFVFENYDKTLFEPTILTPLVKVFKLKL